MNQSETLEPAEYILAMFEANDRMAILALNRDSRETVQRITRAEKAASPEFQAWLRYKNANGSDIYIGMNPGGENALKQIQKSDLVPKPNFVLTSSPDKFQVVWKVADITLDDAEALLHALAREFGGDPAATDATRVLRLPGFANKKYDADFYVEAVRHSTDRYHLRDFKVHIDGQDSPRQNYHSRIRRESAMQTLSQSERDWAFAKRALARGDDPEHIVRRIAKYRAGDKPDPLYYAHLTVQKAQAETERAQQKTRSPEGLESTRNDDPLT